MAMTSRSRGLIRMFVVKCWEMRIAHFVGKLCDIWLDIMIKRGMTVGPYFQIDPYCKVASQKYWCWGLFCLVIYQRQCLKLTIAGVMGQGWGSVPARSWLMVDSPSKTGHFSSTPVGNVSDSLPKHDHIHTSCLILRQGRADFSQQTEDNIYIYIYIYTYTYTHIYIYIYIYIQSRFFVRVARNWLQLYRHKWQQEISRT